MATAVKVDDDAKSRLEELQAEIRLRTGKNITQQEPLSRVIDTAYE
jgi:predicted transcriptional regulator